MIPRLLLALALSLGACTTKEPAPASTAEAEADAPAVPARDAIPDGDPTLGDHELVKVIHVGGAMFSGERFVIRDDATVVAVEVVGARFGNPNDPPLEPRVRRVQLEESQMEGLRSLLADPALARVPADVRDMRGSAHPDQVELVLRTASGIVHTRYTPGKEVPESLRLLADLLGHIERRYPPPLPER